jgi:hypothetical protein
VGETVERLRAAAASVSDPGVAEDVRDVLADGLRRLGG